MSLVFIGRIRSVWDIFFDAIRVSDTIFSRSIVAVDWQVDLRSRLDCRCGYTKYSSR